jgi:hypothetical protein
MRLVSNERTVIIHQWRKKLRIFIILSVVLT